MKVEEKATLLLNAGVLFYSCEENMFFTGGHVGLGEFDLREVDQDVNDILFQMLKVNAVRLEDKEFTNTCVGSANVDEQSFKPYWVKFRKVNL